MGVGSYSQQQWSRVTLNDTLGAQSQAPEGTYKLGCEARRLVLKPSPASSVLPVWLQRFNLVTPRLPCMSKWFNRGVSFKGLLGGLHETGDKGLSYLRLQDEDLDTGAVSGSPRSLPTLRPGGYTQGREVGLRTIPRGTQR